MEEIKVNGIVLNVTEYGEKDALISLFTVELGKITVKMKGVKSDKAKFKYACQPFCFGEWVCVKRGEFFTLTSFSLIDNFYNLTLDYNKYVICYTFLEMCEKILKPNIISEKLFVGLITALKNVVYEEIDETLVAVKFYLTVISLMGYQLTFDQCGLCNMKIKSDIYLSKNTNDFCCASCCNRNGQLVSKEEYNTLKIIAYTNYENLINVKIKGQILKNSLIILKNDFENITNTSLISFSKL